MGLERLIPRSLSRSNNSFVNHDMVDVESKAVWLTKETFRT